MLPEDPKVRNLLASWPSVGRLPGVKFDECDREVRLDVLTHLQRCVFRQNKEVSEYELQEGVAGAIRFLRMQKMDLERLLDEKVYYRPDYAKTGLGLAFLLKDIEIAEALIDTLKYGPSIWLSPLFELCSDVYVDRAGDICGKMTLAKQVGWSPKARDKKCNTALHLSALNNCMEVDILRDVVGYYKNSGCLDEVLDTENKEGHTPLMLCMHGDGGDACAVKKISFLLDAGADPKRYSSVSGRNLLTELALTAAPMEDATSRNLLRALLRRLFEMGMKLDELDRSGVSALDMSRENASFWSEAMFVSGRDASLPLATKVPTRL